MATGICSVQTSGAVEESAKGEGPIGPAVPLMLFLMAAILMLQLQSFQKLFLVVSVAPPGRIGVVTTPLKVTGGAKSTTSTVTALTRVSGTAVTGSFLQAANRQVAIVQSRTCAANRTRPFRRRAMIAKPVIGGPPFGPE